jgi:hypothetical protein
VEEMLGVWQISTLKIAYDTTCLVAVSLLMYVLFLNQKFVKVSPMLNLYLIDFRLRGVC